MAGQTFLLRNGVQTDHGANTTSYPVQRIISGCKAEGQ